MIPGRRRRQSPAADDDILRFSMMPFLDVLFSAIGIFIILFAINQVLSHKKRITTQADELMICYADKQVSLITTNRKVTGDIDTIVNLLKQDMVRTRTTLHLLIALKPDAFATWEELRHKLEKLAQIDEQNRNAALRLNLTQTLWPLPDSPDSEKMLIQKWLDEK